MLDFLTKFASAAAESTGGSSDLLGSLGIDWQMLGLQMISFIILVFIVAKFIYPQIAAMLDRREKIIDDAMKASREAQKKADAAEGEIAKMLANARDEATSIIDTAKKESTDIVSDAEASAQKHADTIVSNAMADINREVESARKTLRGEMVNLVAAATEKVVDSKIDARDEKIIAEAVKGHK